MNKNNKFGKAFPEGVKKVSSRTHHYHRSNANDNWQDFLMGGQEYEVETDKISDWRKVALAGFLLLIFFIFFTRLFHLQVVEGSHNRELADSNRIKVKIVHAPRGVIYDRKGKILAQNEPAFRLAESSNSAIRFRYIDRDEALKMEINNDPQFNNLEIDTKRFYPLAEKTAHILGYVAEITPEELNETQYKNYRMGDNIGRAGIEETYEKILRGVDGAEIIEIDAAGRKVRTLRQTQAIPGQNLYLSIDADLQSVAYDQLNEQLKKVGSCCGSIVIQNPMNGELLSLVSIPSFDTKELTKALTAPNSPFLNRAIAGTYPPGSTFKIISSLAGLSSGKISASTHFEDTGVMKLGPYSFANWLYTQYGRTEGSVDVVKALQRSNDIFYYQLGYISGEKVIADYARKMGFGHKLGIDISGEAAGVIPDNDWKLKNIGVEWYPGDTLHMSIGQGFVLSTPLQISNMISTIASFGKQYPPHLALKITDTEDREIKQFRYDSLNKESIKPDFLRLIQSGLNLVPKEGGTAYPFFKFPIPTAGKTGTAEFGHPKGKTHAWYTSYGPVSNPEIAITVLVEEGGEGSAVASPVAKEIYRWYFSEDKSNLVKDINSAASPSAQMSGD